MDKFKKLLISFCVLKDLALVYIYIIKIETTAPCPAKYTIHFTTQEEGLFITDEQMSQVNIKVLKVKEEASASRLLPSNVCYAFT